MKNKGFTLVELLGVIIILSVIALITFVTVSGTIKDSKEQLYDAQIELIIMGAKTWASSNVFKLPENDKESITITLLQLKQSGFVESDITNPITGELFSDNLQIKITKIDNNYKYEVIE